MTVVVAVAMAVVVATDDSVGNLVTEEEEEASEGMGGATTKVVGGGANVSRSFELPREERGDEEPECCPRLPRRRFPTELVRRRGESFERDLLNLTGEPCGECLMVPDSDMRRGDAEERGGA